MCTKYWLTACCSQACLGKSVVRWIDLLDMTIAVNWDVKHQTKQSKKGKPILLAVVVSTSCSIHIGYIWQHIIKLIIYESSKMSLTDSGLMIFVVLQATIDVYEPRPYATQNHMIVYNWPMQRRISTLYGHKIKTHVLNPLHTFQLVCSTICMLGIMYLLIFLITIFLENENFKEYHQSVKQFWFR